MKRWTPDASPIAKAVRAACLAGRHLESCGLALATKIREMVDCVLGHFRQSARPFHLERVALKIGGIPVLFNGPHLDDLAARLLGTAEPDGLAARTVAGLFRELTLWPKAGIRQA